jgi:hypothetical protein
MVRTRLWVRGTSLEFDVRRAEARQKLPNTQLVQTTAASLVMPSFPSGWNSDAGTEVLRKPGLHSEVNRRYVTSRAGSPHDFVRKTF